MHAFIINLERSKSRLARSRAQLANTPLIIDVIKAVNGAQLSESELDDVYSLSANLKQYHKTLSRGEIGCHLSHRKAWSKIIEKQLPYALILEDDFELIQPIERLIMLVEHTTLSWDMIKLSAWENRPREALVIEEFDELSTVIFPKKIPSGALAYVLSYEGAKKLLQHTKTIARPIDVNVQYWWEVNLRVVGAYPPIFRHDTEVSSDINSISARKKCKTYPLKKAFQKLYFVSKAAKHSKNMPKGLYKVVY